ncbi:MAG: class I SAM-dependent methyltransferase [Dehalococcoidia bacterium]
MPPHDRYTERVKEDIARYWDERYRGRGEEERPPADFLVRHIDLLPGPGRALDVAMGTGRNALFLASRGYEVTGIDISPLAVERCQQEAQRRGLRIETICANLESYPLLAETFGVVLNLYYLQRELCPRLVEALRPGGVLVFETFTLEQPRFGWGPREEEFLLRPGELRELFLELEVLVYRESIEEEDERGMKAVAGLVGRKRVAPPELP